MEITTLTADQLQLKQGGGSFGVVFGVILVIAAAVFGYFVDKSQYIGIGFAVVIALAGIFFIFTSSTDTLDANKQSGQLSYQEKRLTGTKKSMHAIADVSRIEIEWRWQTEREKDSDRSTSSDSDSDDSSAVYIEQTYYVSSSSLIFNDGKKIYLLSEKTLGDLAEKEIVAGTGVVKRFSAQVAEFFNVPVKEVKS